MCCLDTRTRWLPWFVRPPTRKSSPDRTIPRSGSGTLHRVERKRLHPLFAPGLGRLLIKWCLLQVLTHHKKSVRALVSHPEEYTYASGAPDNIKVWQCPNGVFLRNVTGHNAIVNALAINSENVLVSGGDDGSLKFFDWKSGYNFQSMNSIVQPGSLDAEAGMFQYAGCAGHATSDMRVDSDLRDAV